MGAGARPCTVLQATARNLGFNSKQIGKKWKGLQNIDLLSKNISVLSREQTAVGQDLSAYGDSQGQKGWQHELGMGQGQWGEVGSLRL